MTTPETPDAIVAEMRAECAPTDQVIPAPDSLMIEKWRVRECLGRLTAALARERQAAGCEPVAWWNGTRRGNPDEGTHPSFSETEDTWHDIPVYAGFNPLSETAATVAALQARIAAHAELISAVRDYLRTTSAFDCKRMASALPAPPAEKEG